MFYLGLPGGSVITRREVHCSFNSDSGNKGGTAGNPSFDEAFLASEGGVFLLSRILLSMSLKYRKLKDYFGQFRNA